MEDDDGTEAATRDFDEGDDENCVASWCSRSGDREAGALLPRCCWRRSSISRGGEKTTVKNQAILEGQRSSECLFYFCGFFESLSNESKKKETRKMTAFAKPPPAIARRRPPSKAWMSPRSSSVRRACVAVTALLLTIAATAVSSSSSSFSASYSRVAVFYSTVLITPSIPRLASVIKSARSFPRCAGVAARLIATAVDAGGEN